MNATKRGEKKGGEDSSWHTGPAEDIAINQLCYVLFPLKCLYPNTRLFPLLFAAKKKQRASLKPSGNVDTGKWGRRLGKNQFRAVNTDELMKIFESA